MVNDITKCSGEGCHKKHLCHRFLAISDDPFQSWMSTEGCIKNDHYAFWPKKDDLYYNRISRKIAPST